MHASLADRHVTAVATDRSAMVRPCTDTQPAGLWFHFSASARCQLFLSLLCFTNINSASPVLGSASFKYQTSQFSALPIHRAPVHRSINKGVDCLPYRQIYLCGSIPHRVLRQPEREREGVHRVGRGP